MRNIEISMQQQPTGPLQIFFTKCWLKKNQFFSSAQVTRRFAFLGHVVWIAGALPLLGPSAAARVIVLARGIHASVTGLSTVNIHVFHIVLAFALGCPQLAIGLEALVGLRQKIRAVRVLVLAATKAARILAIEAHVHLVAGTFALEGPLRTFFVLVRAGWW